jgi:thioredoxin reductase
LSFDTIIVGGSFAALSAALYLARARRSVLVLDTGASRNRFAAASHGFFAQDGSDPKAMHETMRGQVAAYPTIQFRDLKALDAARNENGFRVTLENGEAVTGARLLLAFGVSDILPELPGLAERWGKTVIHCPYCHGYEFSGQRLGVLNLSPMSAHQATLISEWGPTTFFLNGGTIDAAIAAKLDERGVAIEAGPVDCLVGEGRACPRSVCAMASSTHSTRYSSVRAVASIATLPKGSDARSRTAPSDRSSRSTR